MKKLLLISILLSAQALMPCGPDFSDYDFFYNLFDQENISDPELKPFIRTGGIQYYDNAPYSQNELLAQWTHLLRDWNLEDIRTALYSQNPERQKEVWKGHNSKAEKSARTYMDFARSCSQALEYRHRRSWSYSEIKGEKKPDLRAYIEEGLEHFEGKIGSRLKLHYAYQIIRLMHYSGESQEATDFFEHHKIRENYARDEIYYYTLDQAAGCYYNLEKYDEAAIAFLEVFSESRDRKESAYLSYRWSRSHVPELEQLARDNELHLGYIAIQSFGDFDNELSGLKQLVAMEATAPEVELIFARAVNNLERKIWPRSYWKDTKPYPQIDSIDSRVIQDLQAISDGLIAKANSSRADFWRLASSYLAFLDQDLTRALSLLTEVKGEEYASQREVLSYVYTVFSWPAMNVNREEEVADILAGELGHFEGNWDDDFKGTWKKLLLDQIAHLYLKENEYAKAFLIHNNCNGLTTLSSLPLIDSLISFTAQEEKSSLEKHLLQRVTERGDPDMAMDFLHMARGKVLLQNDRLEEAKHAFETIHEIEKLGNQNYTSRMSAPARLFSNNIMECFDCPASLVMDDKVYASEAFSFIPDEMNMLELSEVLLQLKSMCSDPIEWKQKLAHYLLANYYYNVENTGYYRGLLSDQSNCCHYNYFSRSWVDTQYSSLIIESDETYNLSHIYNHEDSWYSFAEISLAHYKSCIALSSDRELNARCTYLIAKCELNISYNEGISTDYWDKLPSIFDDLNAEYFESLDELKSYEDTEFYNRIINECSYFEYYVSL